ncbi:hypothetical protein PBRA_001935 [Plasmodiophora brassicae]|uniref:Man1/Src1-like C-terminal domain-containing protein n=1 Tax=Plasmodiophora brassicae TaxID=37360 RepID=A0A0G4J1W0_PLABS|nr:hypothetical protein PBRA_001935 [Plasmodiophora brassicae]
MVRSATPKARRSTPARRPPEPEPESRSSSEEQDTDYLALSDEELALLDETPDAAVIARRYTIAALRTWLTEREIALPTGAARKPDYVALVIQHIDKQRDAMKDEAPAKKDEEQPKTPSRKPVVRRGTTPKKRKTVPRTPAKEPAEEAEEQPPASPTKKRKVDESPIAKTVPTTPFASPVPMVATTFLARLKQSRASTSEPIEGPVPDSGKEVAKTPPKPAEDVESGVNKFQRSSSAKKKSAKARMRDGEPAAAPKQPPSSSLLGTSRDQPQTPVEPRKLFAPSSRPSSSPVRRVTKRPFSTLRTIILPAVSIIVAGLAFLIARHVFVGPVYCPTDGSPQLEDCLPCPARASCDSAGRAHCRSGLVLHRGKCIDDPRVVTLAEQLLEDAAWIAAEQLGRVECGEVSGPREIPQAELEQRLKDLHGSEPQFQDAYRKMLSKLQTIDPQTTPLRYNGTPPRIWSTVPHRSFSCAVRQWLASHIRTFVAIVVTAFAIAFWVFRRRRHGRRVALAIQVYKAALGVLKDSVGAVALDHLSVTAFEQSGFARDDAVWALALEQLMRDARINNSLVFLNGVQKKGLVFSQIPLRSSGSSKPAFVYPSAPR